ncbi:glycosyltransferase [uncultured Ruegeria sp.]|uniref:glycosyltransferase n=1 Tax=uncultured Ruegeria sp. TaxID=259304 RepID=UPI00260E65CF|nr:glycosyltransferase [uncultured Ruegeria sp.]
MPTDNTSGTEVTFEQGNCSGVKRHVLYLAHDLDDAAIWRRVDMLRTGGADVSVVGFRRRSGPLSEDALVLGQTHNGKMLQRVFLVLKLRLRLHAIVRNVPPVDAILCRNLEMLALAVPLLRVLRSTRPVSLVYEVLDIHRLMVGQSIKARVMRWIERRLCQKVDQIVVSSPAFQREYFVPVQHSTAPILLVENKVVAQSDGPSETSGRSTGAVQAVLRIGWFGILRCRFSLRCLDTLTRANPGRYKIVLRGRPALDELPDFHDVVEGNPDLVFEGPYSYPNDLAAIYRDVDLAWMIDRYDSGGNSDWLLPNRLYESGLNGVPPVALAGTETARLLGELGIGLILEKADDASVISAMEQVSPEIVDHLHQMQHAVPPDVWQVTRQDACDLVAAITEKQPFKASESINTAQDAVLIVIPTFNEAEHIAGVVDGLTVFLKRRREQAAHTRLVIADGGSTDGTQDIVRDKIAALPHYDIRLLDNPARYQSAGVNAACARYGEGMDWLVRLDAHSDYPVDYIDILLAEAGRTKAASVVVPMHAVGATLIQHAIAVTQNARLGNGGSAHRTGGFGRFVDHGHHALMRLDAFRSVGGYDPRFSHNEDAELDRRLTQSGHRIWLTSNTRLEYFPRSTITALFRQYFNFGGGRARTMLKHRQMPRLRQAAMIGIAPLLGLAALAPIAPIFALPAVIWISACLISGATFAATKLEGSALGAGPIAIVMHLGWSAGFWKQLLLRPSDVQFGDVPISNTQKPAIPLEHIAVGVCTYQRTSLMDTLTTLEHQNLPNGTKLSIIVVDNDASPSARSIVDEFAAASRHQVIYRFAPAGNIAIARNAALEEAELQGLRAFAFIDDDELAPPNWLSDLVVRLADADADVVVGPVRAGYGPEAPRWMRALRIHDTTPELGADGRPIAGHSCNVIMDLGSDALAGRRFDLDRGVSGGEDTAFFKEAVEHGARIAFAPHAQLEEPVTPSRATMSWLMRRRFRMGQTHGSLLRQHGRGSVRLRALPLAVAKVIYCVFFALITAPSAARRNANLLRGALHCGTIASLIGVQDITVYGEASEKA